MIQPSLTANTVTMRMYLLSLNIWMRTACVCVCPLKESGLLGKQAYLTFLFLRRVMSGPEQHCYSILTKTMFIKNRYILWIIPFINLPTSPFGASEIRVINLWVSEVFPRRLPVDCSAAVYLLAEIQEPAWQLVKCFAYHLTLVSLSSRCAANNVNLYVWPWRAHFWGNFDSLSATFW